MTIEPFVQTIAPLFDASAIRTIFDVGSRDAEQAEELQRAFPNAHAYAFECNPETLPLCNAVAERVGVTVVPKAVNDFSGECSFYPLNHQKSFTAAWPSGNPGASSLMVAVNSYFGDTYVQDEITVPCIRLDDYCAENSIERVDLIWMDLQGAELLALKSLGPMLCSVKAIHTEVSFFTVYKDQVLFDELDSFLEAHGFVTAEPVYANPDGEQVNVTYLNTLYLLDVVVCLGERDLDIFSETIDGIVCNIVGARSIYVIAAVDPGDVRCKWIPESRFPFTKDDVVAAFDGDWADHAYWYYQQLLKLHVPRIIENLLPRYVIIDADVLMLFPTVLIEQDTGKPVFVRGKNEVHEPYVEHMRNLKLAVHNPRASITSHLMVFERKVVCELLEDLEARFDGPAWRIYLQAVSHVARSQSGSSEQEVYASFVWSHYPESYVVQPVLFDDAKSARDDHRQAGYYYVARHWYMRQPVES